MPREEEFFIVDIYEATLSIQRIIGNCTQKAFVENEVVRLAVLHQILVIGEAAKRISEEVRAKQPKIPWKEISGMRDKLIHEYFDVDYEEVWKTAKEDIPRLQELIAPLLPPEK